MTTHDVDALDEIIERVVRPAAPTFDADDAVRPLLDLEGLRRWLTGRLDRYAPLERAVDRAGFYDDEGRVTAADYRP